MDLEEQQTLPHSPFAQPIRCIVKLGGAAITCKNELEMINDEILHKVAEQLRQAMISSSQKPPGMDWSKRHGASEICCNPDEFKDHSVIDCSPFIVVHGAEGIPSIGMSPFSCGWFTKEKHISSGDLSSVAKAIESGFTPGCSILSGDVIISHLAAYSKPKYVVFMTDVYGVYDRPPTEPDAMLLKEIAVAEDGSWSVINPMLQNSVELTVAAHDTTGGMETKISEAAMIAKLGIDVYIVKAATSHSLRALSGVLRSGIPNDWLGTVVRSSR
ncbi:hypothetical protein Ahy_A05g024484 isoform D [Arachis hypogaea]|uniref:Aspartate/glutamate/uridylate kinase domain-containing protein n=1 Tax=Arachis hypogaea TaxID=3818 RepID=A0A445D624_ARAHY|nr:hypothetical protein Ahy_A05g024484 isoform D [Arachis hypogaea]